MEGNNLRVENVFRRNRRILKLIIALSSIYMLFFLSLILMVYYLGIGYSVLRYLGISIDQATIAGCAIYVIFIILAVLLHLVYLRKKREMEEQMKPKPIFHQGKRLYIFTYPPGARGGVYAKTTVDIDNETAILIKQQILGPEDIIKMSPPQDAESG